MKLRLLALLCAIMIGICGNSAAQNNAISAKLLENPASPNTSPYLYYQIVQGQHTLYLMVESGLNAGGVHSFHVPLPSAIAIKAIHGTNDYSPWCSSGSSLGLAYGIQQGNTDFLWNDKLRLLNGLEKRQGVDKVFQTPITTGSLDFNYFVDLDCNVVTVSHAWIIEF